LEAREAKLHEDWEAQNHKLKNATEEIAKLREAIQRTIPRTRSFKPLWDVFDATSPLTRRRRRMADTGCTCPDENTRLASCPRHGYRNLPVMEQANARVDQAEAERDALQAKLDEADAELKRSIECLDSAAERIRQNTQGFEQTFAALKESQANKRADAAEAKLDRIREWAEEGRTNCKHGPHLDDISGLTAFGCAQSEVSSLLTEDDE